MTNSYRILDTVARDSGNDNYQTIADRVSKHQSFAGSSMHGFRAEDGTYVIASYRTVIATVAADGAVSIIDKNHWGPTTGRHINICKRAL
jgi:hypothetical protein